MNSVGHMDCIYYRSVFCLLLLTTVLNFSGVCSTVVYITPHENFTNNCTNWTGTTQHDKCLTLSGYALTLNGDHGAQESTQQLILMPGNHTLNIDLSVANFSLFSMSTNVTLNATTTVTVTCIQRVRFLFHKVGKVHINGLHLFGCTESILSEVEEFTVYSSAFNGHGENGSGLNMSDVKNAFVSECSFQWLIGSSKNHPNDTRGGAIIAYNTNIIIRSSEFYHNRASYGGALFGRKSNITFNSCTFVNNTASTYGGVLYAHSGRVTMNSSTATNNRAKFDGGVALVSTGSFVTINNSSFTFNEAKTGGAVRLLKRVGALITDTNFSHNMARGQPSEPLQEYGGALFINRDGNLSIHRTRFYNNTATYVGGALYSKYGNLTLIDVDFSDNSAQRGGGLFVSTSTATVVHNVYFTKNRASYDGGAIWTEDCVMNINHSQFVNNSADRASAIRFLKLSQVSTSEVTISDTSFVYNWANFSTINLSQNNATFSGNTTFWGNKGSLYIFGSNLTITGHANFSQNSFLLKNSSEGGAVSTFQSKLIFNGHSVMMENTAEYGGALYAIESEIFNYGRLFIENNTAIVAGGGVYAYQSGLNFKTSIAVIARNNASENGGGLFISTSLLRVFGGSLEITGNTAKQGGGASFEMNGKLYIIKDRVECFNVSQSECSFCTCRLNGQEWIRVDFVENKAEYGGAMYISDESNSDTCNNTPFGVRSTAGEQCFLQGLALYSFNFLTKLSSNFRNTRFIDNVATAAGSIIYGGLLDRCSFTPFTEVFKDFYAFENYSVNSVDYLKTLTNLNDSLLHKVSSKPVRICFCYNGRPNCSYEVPTIYVRKSETFTIPAAAVDQINSSLTNVTIRGTLVSSHGALNEGESSQQTNNVCTNLKYTISSPNTIEQLALFAEGPCKDIGISKRTISVSFLPCDPCPIGFKVPSSHCSCECDPRLFPDYIIDCSYADKTVQRKDKAWIAYVNETSLEGIVTFPQCPYDYCLPISDSDVSIDLNVKDGSDAQCASGRSKLLCGACEDGFSLMLGGSKCKPCSNAYLLLLVVFAFAGIALVLLVLVCNLTVAIGTINGLTFYANIVAANQSVLVPVQRPFFRIITIFIAWLNLDFGIETCFYAGLNAYSKTWLQLVFPAYVLFLAIVLVGLSKCYKPISNLLRNRDPIATLATLLLLCFTKLIRFIIDVISFASIDYPDGSRRSVWLLDANVRYLELKHIPLFLTALLFLVILCVFTLSLFSWQWLKTLCSKKKHFRWMVKLFQPYFVPHSPKHCYWTGLLLLVRLLLYLILAVNVLGDPSINLLSVVAATLVLLFLKERYVTKVYKNLFVDALESLYILNLLLFSGTSLYVQALNGRQEIVAALSLVGAFVTFVTIVCYHTYEYLLNAKYQKKLLRVFAVCRFSQGKAKKSTKSSENIQASKLLSIENDLTHYANLDSINDDSAYISGDKGMDTSCSQFDSIHNANSADISQSYQKLSD